MATLAFAFGTPSLGNEVDATVNYTLGVRFQTADALDCVGVEWFVPSTAPTGTCTLRIWDVGSTTVIASATADFTGLGGTLVRTLFGAPVALSAATDYMATVHTPNRYVATPNYAFPQTDGPLTAEDANGWLQFAVDPSSSVDTFPTIQSGNSGNFHVSPVLDDGAGAVTTKTGTDTAAGRDTFAGLAAFTSRSEGARGAESAGVFVAVTASDTARAADARVTLAATVGRTDAGHGAEGAPSAPATLTAADAGHWAEASVLDTGNIALKTATDAGHFAELAALAVIDHGHISDVTVGRARTLDRTTTRARTLVRGLD